MGAKATLDSTMGARPRGDKIPVPFDSLEKSPGHLTPQPRRNAKKSFFFPPTDLIPRSQPNSGRETEKCFDPLLTFVHAASLWLE